VNARVYAVAGVILAGLGVGVFVIPDAPPAAFCAGNTCTLCLVPVQAECEALMRCGGQPCSAIEPEDLYAGADARLARALLAARSEAAIEGWHVTHQIVDGGLQCSVEVLLTQEQFGSWMAAGVAEIVTTCDESVVRSQFAGIPNSDAGPE
jgi:hypothetical protein